MKKSKTRRLSHRSTVFGESDVRQRKLLFAVYFLFAISVGGLGGIFVCASMKLPGPISTFFGPLCFTAFGLGTTLAMCRAISGRVPFTFRHGGGIVTREDNPIAYWISTTLYVLLGLGMTAFGVYLFVTGGRH
jgi:hypothetical protein